MNTLDYLNSKIDELNASLNTVVEVNPKDLERINKELSKVEEYLTKIEQKDEFITKEFRKLLNDNNITYDEKLLNEIKRNMLVSKQLGFGIEYSESQLKLLDDIKKGLLSIKKKYESELDKLSHANNETIKKNVEELAGLSKVVEGTGRRKYYTREMIEAFLGNMPDLNGMTLDEASQLLAGIYSTKNITGGSASKQKQELSEVKEVFSAYLDPEKYKEIEGILDKYSDIICSYIDLYNSMDILEFFKENHLIDRFENLALVKIAVFGNSNHVQKIFEKVVLEDTPDKDVFMTDASATLWVSDGTKRRKKSFRYTRGANNKDDDFYESCHRATYDEYKENIEFLRENKESFSENFDPDNIGAHLDVTTEGKKKMTLDELLMNSLGKEKRNFNLFKIFGLNRIHNVPISSLKIGDVENKIHLAIELGLLNPPETEEYTNMDALLPRNQIFMDNLEKNKKDPETMRNYFARNLSVLASLSVNQYAIMAQKQKEMGQLGMYKAFFSEKKAGDRNPKFISDFDKLVCQDEAEMRKMIAENFADPAMIRDYYMYDEAILEVDAEKEDSLNYFDESILQDELISKLEEKYRIPGNPYIYLMDGVIVSRYKVLHNASNLKEFFKYFNEDMLKVCVFRNSFFSFDEYDKIENCIKERGLVK